MAKSDASDGLIAAVAAAAPAAPIAEQIELLPPARAGMTDDEKTRFDAAVRHGRAGRPPGAQNKTTRETLDFVRKVLGDPLIESARWAMHTPDSLALVLGCSKGEAFDRLEKLRADLRPYFYAKQAPVDSDGKAVPGLTVEFHGHGAAVDAAGRELPPWLRDGAQGEQNQRVIDVTPRASNGDVSCRDDK